MRTLKNSLHKHIISCGKNVYIEKLDNIVSDHNNTIHSRTKMKTKAVTFDTYNEYASSVNEKKPTF